MRRALLALVFLALAPGCATQLGWRYLGPGSLRSSDVGRISHCRVALVNSAISVEIEAATTDERGARRFHFGASSEGVPVTSVTCGVLLASEQAGPRAHANQVDAEGRVDEVSHEAATLGDEVYLVDFSTQGEEATVRVHRPDGASWTLALEERAPAAPEARSAEAPARIALWAVSLPLCLAWDAATFPLQLIFFAFL